MYDDGIKEIEFSTPICPDTSPHPKHRIAGTWREECPGRAASETSTIKAKNAPLGMQLWPTASPKYAPNFTLASVIRQVGSNGHEYVVWVDENGNTRMFLADEDVAVQLPVLAGGVER